MFNAIQKRSFQFEDMTKKEIIQWKMRELKKSIFENFILPILFFAISLAGAMLLEGFFVKFFTIGASLSIIAFLRGMIAFIYDFTSLFPDPQKTDTNITPQIISKKTDTIT